MLHRTRLLLARVVWVCPLFTAAAADLPFWRTKERFRLRVLAGEPVVAVSSHEAGKGQRRLTIIGGGRVRAPRDFTWNFARRLERVARLSRYVERAEPNPAGDRLHLVFRALGVKAEFDLAVKRDDDRHRLRFDVIGGPLGGLGADLDFAVVSPKETELSIDGDYAYRDSFLKETLLTVGLEGVFKMVATELRDGVVAEALNVDNFGPPVEHSAAPHEGG